MKHFLIHLRCWLRGHHWDMYDGATAICLRQDCRARKNLLRPNLDQHAHPLLAQVACLLFGHVWQNDYDVMRSVCSRCDIIQPTNDRPHA
jgi:hypothetical protein